MSEETVKIEETVVEAAEEVIEATEEKEATIEIEPLFEEHVILKHSANQIFV